MSDSFGIGRPDSVFFLRFSLPTSSRSRRGWAHHSDAPKALRLSSDLSRNRSILRDYGAAGRPTSCCLANPITTYGIQADLRGWGGGHHPGAVLDRGGLDILENGGEGRREIEHEQGGEPRARQDLSAPIAAARSGVPKPTVQAPVGGAQLAKMRLTTASIPQRT